MRVLDFVGVSKQTRTESGVVGKRGMPTSNFGGAHAFPGRLCGEIDTFVRLQQSLQLVFCFDMLVMFTWGWTLSSPSRLMRTFMVYLVRFRRNILKRVVNSNRGEIWVSNYSESTQNQLNLRMMSTYKNVLLDDKSPVVVKHVYYCLNVEWLGVEWRIWCLETGVWGRDRPDISLSSC